MTTATTKKVSVWYDNRPGVEPGWVARCTEFDADGDGIAGRVAMDEPLNAGSEDTAHAEAADHFGVSVDDVTVE